MFPSQTAHYESWQLEKQSDRKSVLLGYYSCLCSSPCFTPLLRTLNWADAADGSALHRAFSFVEHAYLIASGVHLFYNLQYSHIH